MTEAMPGRGTGLLFAARLRLGSSSAWTIFGGSRVVLELWIKLDINTYCSVWDFLRALEEQRLEKIIIILIFFPLNSK